MLKITNLRKTFNPGTVNEKVALEGLNLTIEDGEFVTAQVSPRCLMPSQAFGSRTTALLRSTAWMFPICRSISVPHSWVVCSRIP